MPRKNLTDRFVASVRVEDRVTYFDGKVRGLAFRVSPQGRKTWHFVYRVNKQKPQWLGLGSYPGVSLADARQQAGEHRRAVEVERRDPIAEREAARIAAETPPPPAPAVFTFANMAALYVTFAKGKKKTWRDDVQKIEKYLLPAWGAMPLRDITRTHVHELLDTLVTKGLTVGVNRMQSVISRIFTLALDRSLVDAHPVARMIKRFDEPAGERVLTDDEIRALWTGLDQHPGAAADALRLRLVLGQRGQETAGMAWAELDLDARIWEIPGRRTKNGRPHVMPLPSTALEIIERQQAVVPADEPRVFPGLTLQSDQHRALGVLHGGSYEWKDLRRTVGTRLAGLGYDDTTIGRTLNHARYTVTGKVYNKHLYLDEKRAALDAWDRELHRILKNEPKVGAKVLGHRPRRTR